MNALPDELDAALDACMEASAAQARWGGALQQLSDALGFVGCSLNTNNAASRLALPATTTYRDMPVDFVREGWQTHDLRCLRGWGLVSAGAAVVTEDMISTVEERERLPFYRGFLRRYDMQILAGIGFKVGQQLWSLSGARSARQGIPSPADRALFERTQPHIRRFLRFSEKVAACPAPSRRA